MPETSTPRVRPLSRAIAFGVAIGTTPFWIVYPLAIAALHLPSKGVDGSPLFFLLLIVGGGASAVVMIISLVLAVAERTRPFSAGMAIGGGIGIVAGAVIWASAAS